MSTYFNNPHNRPCDTSIDIALSMDQTMLGCAGMHWAYNTCQNYAHAWDQLLTGDYRGLVKLIFSSERASRGRPSAGVYDTLQHWSAGGTLFSRPVMTAKDYTVSVYDYLSMNSKALKDLPPHPETGERRPHPQEGGNGYMYRRMMSGIGGIDARERGRAASARETPTWCSQAWCGHWPCACGSGCDRLTG